jgi:hypothetical protein
MQAVFKTAPVGLADGMLILGVGVMVLLAVELEKRIFKAFTGGNARSMAGKLTVPAS